MMRKTSLLQKCLSIALVWMATVFTGNAQVTTTVTMSGSPIAGSPFSSLSDAINAVNLLTITGPIIVTAPAGSETAPLGGYSITASGTSTNTILIQGAGAGNTIITAPAPQTTGSINDAIFKLIGADYVTLSGFTMQENVANTNSTINPSNTNDMTEFGVALFYATATDGAQNNTIQNNTISLNRAYRNTIGIYSNTRHSATVANVFAEATSFSGSNSYNKVYGNNISNVNFGIVFYGTANSSSALETGNDIGGSSVLTGNTITNWGGWGTAAGTTVSNYATNASNTITTLSPNAAIFCNHQTNENISNNTITSAALTHSTNVNGIVKQHIYVTVLPTGTITTTINNNTISISNNPTAAGTGQILGISATAALALSTATINITNNTIQNCVLGGTTSQTNPFVGINNTATVGTLNITGNIIRDNAVTASSATSASCTGISQGATATLTSVNISGNTIYNLSTSGTSGTATGISTSFSSNIFKNKIYGLSNTNTGGTALGVNGISIFGGNASITTNIYNNLIGNLTFPAGAATDAIRGINIGATGVTSTHNVSFNTVYINASSTGANFGTTGIFHTGSATSTTTALNLRNNVVINTSTPNGAGLIVALRRNNGSTANTLNNYGSSSNNNLFYAGTPGSTRVVYNDGSTSAQSITDYKNGVFTAGTIAPRDAASISENTTFLSTTGSSTDFLHIDASVVTGTESGGVTVSGVTDDFDGESRPGTPDIGADQFGPVSVWDGSASTDFATAANWDDNLVPGSGANIGIPTGVSNKPQLADNRTVGKITIGSGSFININGNTLTINGAVSGSGTISGSSTSNLTIGGTAGTLNFTSGSRTLKDLVLSASATATLGTALDIVAGSASGSVTVAAGGTLTTGGNLTLKSDANGTARVANSAGSISGNVTVERYIPNTGRKWRLLTAPVSGASSNSVFANWQNNGTVTAGRGVEVWGTAGTCSPGVSTGNGLVPGPGGGAASSLRRYNSSTNTWVNVTNTATEALFDAGGNKAFALFVTGHFGSNNVSVGSGSAATTLAATGSLITGFKAFNFTYEDNAEHIAMIGNPYASPVDFAALSRSNVENKYWVWDPSLDGTGGYVLLTDAGGGNYTASLESGYTGTPASGSVYKNIQSGQAFFVQATGAGAASVTFNEDDKVSTTHTQVFRNGTQTEKFRINLLNAVNPAAIKVIDGALVQYSNTFSNAHGAEDGIKLYNDRENLWIAANGKEYMIEGRKLIDNTDTIKLTTWALQQQDYRLELIGSNFATDANLSAYLRDKYLGTETAISLSGTTEYPFTVSADAGSKATDRFMVVFRSNASLPVTLTNVKAYQQNSGINVEWNTQSESGMQQYEVEKSTNGTSFTKVNTTAAKSGTTNSYNYFDATPNSGANYYRIKAISLNGEVKYSSIVVVKLNSKGQTVTIYPNPIKGNSVQLQLANVERGNYSVTLFNQLGQQVLSKTINHMGGSSNQTIDLGNIAAGMYELRLSNGTTVITQKLIKE